MTLTGKAAIVEKQEIVWSEGVQIIFTRATQQSKQNKALWHQRVNLKSSWLFYGTTKQAESNAESKPSSKIMNF